MYLNPNINYQSRQEVSDLLTQIEATIVQTGMKKSFIAKEVGEDKSTYSKFISALEGYVSEERCRKYCQWINERYE
jgi:hypothetical protein